MKLDNIRIQILLWMISQNNFYINKETGIPIVDIPGGHLGYIQKPEGFADVLLNLWG